MGIMAGPNGGKSFIYICVVYHFLLLYELVLPAGELTTANAHKSPLQRFGK